VTLFILVSCARSGWSMDDKYLGRICIVTPHNRLLCGYVQNYFRDRVVPFSVFFLIEYCDGFPQSGKLPVVK
jgi:hypothetical protein